MSKQVTGEGGTWRKADMAKGEYSNRRARRGISRGVPNNSCERDDSLTWKSTMSASQPRAPPSTNDERFPSSFGTWRQSRHTRNKETTASGCTGRACWQSQLEGCTETRGSNKSAGYVRGKSVLQRSLEGMKRIKCALVVKCVVLAMDRMFSSQRTKRFVRDQLDRNRVSVKHKALLPRSSQFGQ